MFGKWNSIGLGLAFAVALTATGASESHASLFKGPDVTTEYIKSSKADIKALENKINGFSASVFGEKVIRDKTNELSGIAFEWRRAFYATFHRAQLRSTDKGCKTTVWATDEKGEFALREWVTPEYFDQLINLGSKLLGQISMLDSSRSMWNVMNRKSPQLERDSFFISHERTLQDAVVYMQDRKDKGAVMPAKSKEYKMPEFACDRK